MNKLKHFIFSTVQQLPDEWDDIYTNVFLNTPYLKAQEIASPHNMNYFYIALYAHNSMVGKSVVQRIRLKGKELFRSNHNQLREGLISLLNLNMLCIGNIKVTGEHAYSYKDDIAEHEIISQIEIALTEIRRESKKEGLPVQLLLFKDFYTPRADRLESAFKGYEKLAVQPNMVFQVDSQWNNFEDYLSSLRSKYRTRAKRAFRLAGNIKYLELNLQEIKKNEDTLYTLYNNVLVNNGFSVYKLPTNYFSSMKRELVNNFKLFIGVKNDKIVSFYSVIINGNKVEAGFLGYDDTTQQRDQLYLNMLYRIIEFSITNGYQEIDFSRTALEIKSSIGAKPQEMYGFLKHTQPLMNKVLPSTFHTFYQPETWVQRNPFKN